MAALILESRRFGRLEVEEDALITVEDILGFENLRRYILVEHDGESPLHWLISVDEPEIGFVVVEAGKVFAGYEIDLGPAEAEALELEEGDQPAVLVILSVGGGGQVTANLKAPLVVNPRTRRGKQVVQQERDYPLRYPLGGPREEG